MDTVTQATYSPGYPTSMSHASSDGELGLQQLFDIVARNILLLLGITVAVLVLALGATFVMTPKYFASSAIRLDPTAKGVGESVDRNLTPQAEQSRMDTEAEILRSREIANQVITNLHLERDPELAKSARTFDNANVSARDLMIEAFVKNLEVKRNADDYIVSIGYSAQDPVTAARVANAVADAYVLHTVADRTRIATGQAQWLSSRLRSLGAEIQGTQSQVARYRALSGLTSSSPGGTVTDQQVGPLSMQLAQAESESAAAEADLAAARTQIAQGNIGAISGVLNSQVIGDLRRQRAEASQLQAEIDTRYGALHPEHTRIQQQLKELDSALTAEANRIVAGLASKVNSARARVDSLRNSLGRVRSEQADNTRASVTADTLDQRSKAKQTSYDQLSQRLEQVMQTQRDLMPSATVIERAVPPTRVSSPNRLLFAALGLVLGAIAGFATILAKELMSKRIVTPEDLSKHTMLPFIAAIPTLDKKQLTIDGHQIQAEDYIAARPMSGYAEALRTLRNSIILAESAPRVISIISALPSEGKTTVAASLARLMALSGDKVVLVDCDLRRGRVRSLADDVPESGLVEVLSEGHDWHRAIVKDRLSTLAILPCKTQEFVSQDLLSSKTMLELLDNLREEYDFVILDTPPVLAVAESRTVATHADASIFVARSNKTHAKAAQLATERLLNDRSMILGCVLSMITLDTATSRSGAYYYFNDYKGYTQG